MKSETIQNNLTNGEIGPNAEGRFDLAKYANSAKTIENWFIKQLGGAIFRPGTRYVAGAKSDALPCRLLKFQYSTSQNYVIEAGNLYFRFYTDSGQLIGADSLTKLLLHFDGTDGGTTFTDSSPAAHGGGTAFGNAQLDTAQFKFGTASLLLDGTGDYITYADSADWDFGSGDFTIECFIRRTTTGTNHAIFSRQTSGTSYTYFAFEGLVLRFRDFLTSSVVDVTATVVMSTNTWYHVAVTRSGSNFKLWLNGVQQNSTVVYAGALTDRAVALNIGSLDGSAYFMNGWIDDFIWTKGSAKYTTTFTPSTSAEDNTIPVELTTVFTTTQLSSIKYAQNADTMYIATGTHKVYKLQRTNATTFTITSVQFIRGPFLDKNDTSTTITPSAATGAVTLASSSAIFNVLHIGALWRVKDGVVLISGFTDSTHVTGTVQDEPDGTAGDLGGTAATKDWSEAAWSDYRGWPSVVTFHDGRLWFANTTYQPQGAWGSVPYAYEAFDEGQEDDDSINIELNADTVVAIRWLSSSPKGLQAGTTGGVFNINGGSQGQPITPSNVAAPRENLFATADIQGRRMFNYVYYVQNDLKRLLESGYFFDIDSTDAVDTTILADHILNVQPSVDNIFLRGSSASGGAYELDTQQSPNNRVWIVRNDGQIVVLTRNVRQEINGWFHVTAGKTISCDNKSGTGQFESISIIPQEGGSDQIWVVVNRLINGSTKRFIEFFTEEDFKYDWDPVRLDCSLTLDNPITITNIVFLDQNILIYAAAHGLNNGDQIKLDNIVGTHQLNGNIYLVKDASTNTFKLDPVP